MARLTAWPGLWVATTVVAIVVFGFTGLDLWFSRRFFVAGVGFPWIGNGTIERLRGLWNALTWIPLIAVVAAAGSRWLGWRRSPIDWRGAVYGIVVFAVAPGLLVNGLFKTYWGRARPRDILEFGGGETFTPAWVLGSGDGESFMSGEAATAFAGVAMAWAWPGGRPWLRATILTVTLAVPMALFRIGMGGHFLSDVVFAGLTVWLVAAITHRLVGLARE